MKNITQSKKILLLLGDIIILYLSLYITLSIRYLAKPTETLWTTHFWPFTVIFIVWLVIFYIANLYNLHLAINNARFFQMTNGALIVSILASLAFFYSIPQIGVAPKTNLLIYIIIFYTLFFLWRRSFNLILKKYLPKKNIIIIGLDEQAGKIIDELQAKPHLGYRAAFVINDKAEQTIGNLNGVKIIPGIKNLIPLIKENDIDTIIINSDPRQSLELRSMLFDCLSLKIAYISLPSFYENITGKIPLDAINQMWFLENLSESNKGLFDIIKRIYDVILACVILLLTLIFWPLIAVIIKAESKGPVFFKQTRSGKNNRPFVLHKFRTMREEGNDRALTSADDNRITSFGSFLRKSRLDEIPQIINILKGEMSFVGPRPERPEYLTELEKSIPFFKERTLVKPGLTGWDQVSGEYHSPSVDDSIKKLQYDLFYIKNRSIYLDLAIILKTITTMIMRGGR